MAGASRLVVVGASLAGLRAVESARAAGHEGPVTLVGAERHLPYDRPPLSKQLLAPGASSAVAPYRGEEELAALGVELRLGLPATGLDVAARRVRVGEESIGYDALVVATGSAPRPLASAPPGLEGVRTLRTHDDAVAIRDALDAGARTVVVGAGFVGLEVASALRARGVPVTVVEAAPYPLARSLGSTGADLLVARVRAAGVDLRVGCGVAGLAESGGRVTGVVLEDGSRLPADLVVVGVGAVPATGWLEGSGVDLDDGVVCDTRLRTSAPGVWAAGDVVRVRRDATSRRLEHWTSAHEQGRLAGANAVAGLRGEDGEEWPGVAYVWSDLFRSKVQLLGETRDADATEVITGPDGAHGPWLVLLGRDGRLTGVLGCDLAGRVMKFRPLLVRGAGLDEALAQARAKPIPRPGAGRRDGADRSA